MMNPKLLNVIFAIGGAAIGSAITYFIMKRKYEAEINTLCDECTADVNAEKAKTEELKHKHAEELQNIIESVETDKWNDISKSIKEQIAEMDVEGPSEPTSHTPTADIMRKRDIQKDVPYDKYYKRSEEAQTTHEPVVEKILQQDWSSIQLITEDQYDDNEWGYEKQYLNFYIDSEMLYDDLTDELIEVEDVPKWVGVELDELRAMFHKARAERPNDVYEFYICNKGSAALYCINECAGDGPRP